MAAQAEPKISQHGAQPTQHKVRIVYEEGKQYKEGQELEVQDYPPENLKVGDTIAFIPEPAGELRLTFEYGSNFTHENTPKYEILDQQPQTVIRDMSQVELSAYEDRAKRETWSPEARAQVKKNAFPFMCELTVPKTYKGGFPKRP